MAKTKAAMTAEERKIVAARARGRKKTVVEPVREEREETTAATDPLLLNDDQLLAALTSLGATVAAVVNNKTRAIYRRRLATLMKAKGISILGENGEANENNANIEENNTSNLTSKGVGTKEPNVRGGRVRNRSRESEEEPKAVAPKTVQKGGRGRKKKVENREETEIEEPNHIEKKEEKAAVVLEETAKNDRKMRVTFGQMVRRKDIEEEKEEDGSQEEDTTLKLSNKNDSSVDSKKKKQETVKDLRRTIVVEEDADLNEEEEEEGEKIEEETLRYPIATRASNMYGDKEYHADREEATGTVHDITSEEDKEDELNGSEEEEKGSVEENADSEKEEEYYDLPPMIVRRGKIPLLSLSTPPTPRVSNRRGGIRRGLREEADEDNRWNTPLVNNGGRGSVMDRLLASERRPIEIEEESEEDMDISPEQRITMALKKDTVENESDNMDISPELRASLGHKEITFAPRRRTYSRKLVLDTSDMDITYANNQEQTFAIFGNGKPSDMHNSDANNEEGTFAIFDNGEPDLEEQEEIDSFNEFLNTKGADEMNSKDKSTALCGDIFPVRFSMMDGGRTKKDPSLMGNKELTSNDTFVVMGKKTGRSDATFVVTTPRVTRNIVRTRSPSRSRLDGKLNVMKEKREVSPASIFATQPRLREKERREFTEEDKEEIKKLKSLRNSMKENRKSGIPGINRELDAQARQIVEERPHLKPFFY